MADNIETNSEKTVIDNINRNEAKLTPQMHELPRNKRALDKDSDTYMLETFSKNILLIINQENIDGYEPRKGTDKDVKTLSETFEQFRFKVEPHKDLYRRGVAKVMFEFSHLDFTDYGCIAIAILTHGSEKGGLRARDDKYKEHRILELIKTNPTLATKPIIYILQACRGNRLTETNTVNVKTDSNFMTQQYRLPQNADTLVLHSTYAGSFSLRDEDKGSWFIQTLCTKINQLADTMDLESIMTVVKREVAINKEAILLNENTNVPEFNKQMPVTESTLIRKLYFVRNGIDKVPAQTDQPKPHIYETLSTETQRCKICIDVALERFDYVIKSLKHFVEDNPKDTGGKSLMTIARSCSNSDDEAKIEITRLIRDFFITNTKDSDKYKYLYIWKDHVDI